MNVANHCHEPWASANVSTAASPMPTTPGAGTSSPAATDAGLGVTRGLGSLTGLSCRGGISIRRGTPRPWAPCRTGPAPRPDGPHLVGRAGHRPGHAWPEGGLAVNIIEC